ncbi:MAG TPA: class I SAM-dependent methyltransferase [Verrucomicrobiae bacterium]|jgi:23S rRNA (cytosine1962-C5)-methyltransferase|nr:class I SAM-dependent methyltransferase [Verrucomicrobiae bacterium]
MKRQKKQPDEIRAQGEVRASAHRQPPPKREPQRLRLRVTAAAETQLRAGHPWVYGDSIREQNRDGTVGELAVIYDRKDAFLAVGLFDPDSPIRVRILHAGKPLAVDAAFWTAKLTQAIERRHGLFDEQTNGYRIISGESDGWPGLVLDRYDKTLVLKLYTAAWLPRFQEISNLIRAQLKPEHLVLRLSRNIQKAAQEMISKKDGEIIFGDRLEACPTFLESGIRFEADVCHGQKTGFFLDQRENRRAVESLASGRSVLNAFSFSGGFSLYAARGGAASVTDLDISAHALASARRNFALNQSDPAIARCRHELAQADTFDWLAANQSRQFDLVVLDPPSFAKRETERAGAIRGYQKLAGLGIPHMSAGGILVACSCSAHVSAEEFFDAVRLSAGRSTRAFQEIQTTHHAPDHPATFKEAEYLKAIYLRFA